jgi:outer membrane protein TolC
MLATQVANALFQARGDAVQLADARETYRIAQELARSADLSAAHGITSSSDAARLESDAASDAAAVVRDEAVERADRRTLLTLIGHATDPLESVPIEAVAAIPPDPPATTPGELLRRRPDVREAEARLQSAAGTLDLDRLGLYPDFTLNPSIQYAKTGGAYDSASTIWTIAGNATLPVLDRPRLLAAVRAQRAVGEQDVIAYEKAVQDAYRDAENGLYTLQAARKSLADLLVAVQRARFAFDAKRRGYDLGLTDLTTLLTAETTWRQALLAYNSAEVTTLTDSATLFQALGGGWSPPPPTLQAQTLAAAAAASTTQP